MYMGLSSLSIVQKLVVAICGNHNGKFELQGKTFCEYFERPMKCVRTVLL